MDEGPICGLVLRRTTSPPLKLELELEALPLVSTYFSRDILEMVLWSKISGSILD